MGRRGFTAFLLFVLLILCFNYPVKGQSESSTTQEFILDSSMGDSVYSMVLDDHNDLLLVGERVPVNSNDSFRLEGMVLKVNDLGEASEIFVLDNNEVNSITDIVLDSNGNLILAGKGGEWEGLQFGYIMKLSPQGEVMWSIEFPDIYFHDYVGIEINQTTNDVYFTGTASYGQNGIFLSKVNESGGVEWEQIWYQEGYMSMPYTTHSLHLISQGLLLSVDFGESSPQSFMISGNAVVFSTNGTELWTHGEGFDVLRELDGGYLLCTNGSSAIMCDANLEPIWENELELHCDYIPNIYGFELNNSGSILAYGSVIGLGKSPVKGAFSLSYTPAPIPQSLIASISEEGEIEWYDFYVTGGWSVPCGASFDQDGKLVIAGHSEVDSPGTDESYIWVLWNFKPTPFPDVIICNEESIFFGLYGFSLIPVAAVLSWGIYRARKGRVTEDLMLSKAINAFRKGGVFFTVFFFVLGGVVVTPFPSPMYLLPFYGAIISLLFVVTSYIMEDLSKHGKDELEYEPINH